MLPPLPWRRSLLAAALILTPILLAGCSGSNGRYPVEGTVTLDGQPVEGGVIVLFPVDDNPADPARRGKAYGTIQNGKFLLQGDRGAAPGKYRVEITWFKKTGRQIPSNDPPNKIDETKQVIPKQFNEKSTTFVEIKPERNTLHYELKSATAPGKGGNAS
jgi:hypothetical protein